MLEFSRRSRTARCITWKGTAAIPRTPRSRRRGRRVRWAPTSRPSVRCAGRQLSRCRVREKVDSTTVVRTDRAQTGVYITHDAGMPLQVPHELPAALYTAADLLRLDPAIGRGEAVLRVGHQPQKHINAAADAVFAAIDDALASIRVKVAYDTLSAKLWPPARAAAGGTSAIAR